MIPGNKGDSLRQAAKFDKSLFTEQNYDFYYNDDVECITRFGIDVKTGWVILFNGADSIAYANEVPDTGLELDKIFNQMTERSVIGTAKWGEKAAYAYKNEVDMIVFMYPNVWSKAQIKNEWLSKLMQDITLKL